MAVEGYLVPLLQGSMSLSAALAALSSSASPLVDTSAVEALNFFNKAVELNATHPEAHTKMVRLSIV